MDAQLSSRYQQKYGLIFIKEQEICDKLFWFLLFWELEEEHSLFSYVFWLVGPVLAEGQPYGI